MTAMLIQGGHLVDPSTGTDERRDVYVRNGRIAAVEMPGKLTGGEEGKGECHQCNRHGGSARTGRYPRASARAWSIL